MNDPKKRDPYDSATWGPECGRGIQYRTTSSVMASGPGVVRKLGGSRKKFRGKASDSFDLQEGHQDATEETADEPEGISGEKP